MYSLFFHNYYLGLVENESKIMDRKELVSLVVTLFGVKMELDFEEISDQ
jgi:hypothetical protein